VLVVILVGDKLVPLVEKNGIGVLIALTTIEAVVSVVVKIGNTTYLLSLKTVKNQRRKNQRRRVRGKTKEQKREGI